MKKLMSHKEANYRSARFDTRRCGICSMYRAGKPPSCTLVEQPIRASDVCSYFEPKKGARS